MRILPPSSHDAAIETDLCVGVDTVVGHFFGLGDYAAIKTDLSVRMNSVVHDFFALGDYAAVEADLCIGVDSVVGCYVGNLSWHVVL